MSTVDSLRCYAHSWPFRVVDGHMCRITGSLRLVLKIPTPQPHGTADPPNSWHVERFVPRRQLQGSRGIHLEPDECLCWTARLRCGRPFAAAVMGFSTGNRLPRPSMPVLVGSPGGGWVAVYWGMTMQVRLDVKLRGADVHSSCTYIFPPFSEKAQRARLIIRLVEAVRLQP